MTDEKTIKALECCIQVNPEICEECPLYDKTCTEGGDYFLLKLALDLIKRQKEEISKKDIEIDILIRKKETLSDEVSNLRAEVERLQKENECFADIGKMYSEIKSD